VTLTVSSGVPQVQVPNVVGQDVTSAVASLAQRGLDPKIVRIYSTSQVDTVTAQQPAAGDTVPKGQSVRINVSRGAKPVSVPDVRGQPFANAKSALEGQGFSVTRIDIQSDQAKGVVVAESPPAGSSVSKGSQVQLSVSKGPATTQVPDVTNQNQADATKILQQAGLNVSVVVDQVTDPSQDGIVISQDPSGGADATSGEVVIIHVGQLVANPQGNGHGNGNGNGNGNGAGATTTTSTTPTTTATTPAAPQ
jgi:serine/threonine-protein kinase